MKIQLFVNFLKFEVLLVLAQYKIVAHISEAIYYSLLLTNKNNSKNEKKV